jgi:DNA polymerase-3 subunit alpha
MAFVHLHLHSEYSLLDSMVRVSDLVQAAVDDGQPAVAVTDHGDLGAIYTLSAEVAAANAKRAEAAEQAGEEPPAPLKPIVGMEAYLAIEGDARFAATERNTRLQYKLGAAADADADEGLAGARFETARYEHLTILARTNEGWHNLLRLHNLSQERRRVYSKPRIDYDLLDRYSDGLIVLTGCLAGPVAGHLSRARELDALDHAGRVEAARAELLARSKLLVPSAADELDDADSLDDLFERASALLIEEEGTTAREEATRRRRHTFDRLREDIPAALDADRERGMADAGMNRLIEAVGDENVYVEMMHHDHPAEGPAHLEQLAAFARRHEVEPVVTNDCHHTIADKRAHDVWLAHGSKRTLETATFTFDGDGYHLRTEEEMRELFPGAHTWQRGCDNTAVIAERVDDDVLDPYRLRLPSYVLPDGYDSAQEFLQTLVVDGAERIYGERDEDGELVRGGSGGVALPDAVVDRLREEMSVISSMGLWDYFLISWDMIAYCRREGIAIGFGRGSASGSVISYCLGLVGVDPLEYDLLFERFLEPGRAGMPDIDFDIEDARRHEVFAYMREKYGDEHVAHIGAWQNFQSKEAIKSVVRTLGLPGSIGDQLASLIPKKGAVPLSLAYALDDSHEDGRDFRAKVDELGADGEDIIHLATQFEGVTRGSSVHPAGLIVADENLRELIPMRHDRKDTEGTQTRVSTWDMDDVEAYGLLKLDLLGLRNLGFLSLTQRYIEQTTGEVIDYHRLPHPDCLIEGDKRAETSDAELGRVRAAYELLSRGRTPGIFQLDSTGMTDLVVGIAPESLPDLAAAVALYRPGPMGADMHTTYVERKWGRQEVDYTKYTSDPAEIAVLDGVLGGTYGCLLYQEQMMLLGTAVAGFDATWRSKLRKAVGKKIKSVMDEVGTKFRAQAVMEMTLEDGTVKPAYSAEFAQNLWDDFVHSADYIFNSSHAYAYAKLAYATAYLKASWPVEYAAAVLARTPKGDKRQALLNSLASEGVRIEKPDINTGQMITAPKDGAVWIGFSEIRDVPDDGAEAVIAEREKNGPFESMADFLHRITVTAGGRRRKLMNAAGVSALIEAGAFDRFGTRKSLVRIARANPDHMDHVKLPADEWEPFELAHRERNRLGVVLSEDPIASVETDKAVARHRRKGRRDTEVAGRSIGKTPIPLTQARTGAKKRFVYTYGVLTSWAEQSYKRGTMARCTLSFDGTHIEGVMWDRELTEQKTDPGLCRIGMPVAVDAHVEVDKRELDKDENEDVVDDEPRIQLKVARVDEITSAIGDDVQGQPPALRVRPRRRAPGGLDDVSPPRPNEQSAEDEQTAVVEDDDDDEDLAAPVFDEPAPVNDNGPDTAAADDDADETTGRADAFAVPGFDSSRPPHLFHWNVGQIPPKGRRSVEGIARKDVPGLDGTEYNPEQCKRGPLAMRGFTRKHEAVFFVLLPPDVIEGYGGSAAMVEAAVTIADWSASSWVRTLGVDFEIAPIDEQTLRRVLAGSHTLANGPPTE